MYTPVLVIIWRSRLLSEWLNKYKSTVCLFVCLFELTYIICSGDLVSLVGQINLSVVLKVFLEVKDLQINFIAKRSCVTLNKI